MVLIVWIGLRCEQAYGTTHNLALLRVYVNNDMHDVALFLGQLTLPLIPHHCFPLLRAPGRAARAAGVAVGGAAMVAGKSKLGSALNSKL